MKMKTGIRITGVVVAVCVLFLGTLPAAAAGENPSAVSKKVTMNDPLFIPLSEEHEIKKGAAWYVYVLGAALIGLAAGGGDGGGSGDGGSETADVTIGW